LAVDPSHRREGVGARLVERVFEDCERAWVEVRRGNRAAQNFYLKLGFRLAGEIRRYYGDEDAFVMAIEKFNSGTTMQ
jgi:ribosomal-protein-alanine N-acetyltransferase